MARRTRQAAPGPDTRSTARPAPIEPLLEGRRRVVIEAVAPEVDAGRFAVKRTVGESVRVEADVFTDGHDVLACRLLHRRLAEPEWAETPMEELGNDRYAASFPVRELGVYE